ncbi:MAG: lipoprotein [Hydrogenophilaceae bacterium]|jgi:predicted small lipoprotein YifL|nr:lipoprotein [Hydrogenophilaceae bacterium]
MKKTMLIALGAATLLAGCGHRGELQRPGPWWGEDERTAEERAHENEQGARQDQDEDERR